MSVTESHVPNGLIKTRSRVKARGVMADAIAAYDWHSNPVGPAENWSEAHVSAKNLMLACRFPALLYSGPEHVVSYNDAFIPLLAEKHPAALGQRARDVYPEIWDWLEPCLMNVLNTGETSYQENMLIPVIRGGVLKDLYWTFSRSPVFEPDGSCASIFVVCHDTTEELRASRERDVLAEQLRRVLEATSDGVVTIDREWRFSYANPAAMKILAPVQDLLGRVIFEVFPGIEYEASPFTLFLREAMEQGVPGEFEAFYGEPLNRWLHIGVKPRPDGIVIFFRDITEQRLTTEALIKTEKLAAVGRLAASIAHEINNPLESVTNLLYLARNSDSVQEIYSYLDPAEVELRRVSAIANQTLRFHKQASGAQPVACSELLDSVLSIYQGKIVNQGVAISRRDRASESVTCFDGEIRQVLSNLVGNAIDAMQPRGGMLTLRTRQGQDWATMRRGVVLTIADNGTGIDEDKLKRVFEPFFTTKGYGGTGLGLWVSQEIVHRHKGTLSVRSRKGAAGENPRGTVFSLFLPYQAAVRV